MRKLPFPRFASRSFRLLYPMPSRKRRRLTLPDPLQILDLFLLLLHQLFQPFDLLLQLLVQLQRLRQLFLQILHLWIFRFRRMLMPLASFAHVLQCTGFLLSLTRVVSPVFFQTFDPSHSCAFAR